MDWINGLKSVLGTNHAEPDEPAERVSSVLLCLGKTEKAESSWDIILTKRTQLVQTHKGQVSFPGGIQEPHDSTLLHTAIRESEEEIGIRANDLQILGTLPPVDTIGRVRIYPWVAFLPLPYAFKLSFDEVEKIIFLPLMDLLTQGLTPVKVRVEGYDVKSEGILCDGELVWGATAKILKEFRNKALDLVPITRNETA